MASIPEEQRSFCFPRGVADPDSRTGYAAKPAGGVIAINLDSGKARWNSRLVARPLAVAANRLVTLQVMKGAPNRLRVLVLDAAGAGAVVLTSEPIEFPVWVRAALVGSEEFEYEAHRVGEELRLRWAAHGRYGGGAPPPRQVMAQASHEARGIVRVDLNTGQVRMEPDDQREEVLSPAAEEGYPYWQNERWHNSPWFVGGRRALLALETREGAQTLVLKRWDLSNSNPPEVTVVAQGGTPVASLTPDGEYLFVHDDSKIARPDGSSVSWSVWSVSAGRLAASLDYEPGVRDVCVLDRRLYYLKEPSHAVMGGTTALKAREFPGGRLLWEYILPAPNIRPFALRQ